MSKNCPVFLSLVLHLHHEACWCSEYFGNSSSLWSKAKRSCWQSYPHALSASPTVGSTACRSTCVLDSLYSPELMPCHTDALVCSRSIVRDLLHERYFPSDSCWTVKTGPKCSTSGEWDPYPATQAAKASPKKKFTAFLQHFRSQGHQAYTSSHAVNERTFFSSAKVVTLRESPLSLAKNTKTWAPRQCQRRAICPQQPNIFLTSNDDDVDKSWKQSSFHWFLPRMSSDQKNRGRSLHSTLLVLLGEKSGRWSSSPRHGAFSNRSCAHRFAPKWSADRAQTA